MSSPQSSSGKPKFHLTLTIYNINNSIPFDGDVTMSKGKDPLEEFGDP